MFSIRWTVGGNADPFCYLFWTATWNRWNTSYRRRSPSRIHIQRQVRLVDLSSTLFRTWELFGLRHYRSWCYHHTIYISRYNEDDFDNGYSRNLLWRLWHASWAFEMECLSDRCGKVCRWSMYHSIISVLHYYMNIHIFVCALVIIDFR